ncbi:MAG TPA: potassium-transporting ATPase subunit C [Candidatus Bathyarchaeia archaeon]|nr:potassium-transporting ATPase subunit C [Candidatus Bathyarchaeia archaeon]
MLKSDLFAAVKTTVIFLVLCGLVFPLLLVGIAQIADKPAAEGSVLIQNGSVVGSSLVGQAFNDPMHFQSRLSGVSNWGPNNPALIANVSQQVAYQKRLNPSVSLVPIDLVTQSGSGVDPNISPESALLQVPRISNVTGIPQDVLTRLVKQYTENPVAGVFGEPRVNVLLLNIALDNLLSPTALRAAEANATALNALAVNATATNSTAT